MKKTRFAPSPTGYLHIGHAYSAVTCWNWAKEHDAEVILRMEDIDQTRCRSEYVDGIFQDLHWLGLGWNNPVRFQSEHPKDYKAALQKLVDLDVIYPCSCSRKDIQQALGAPHIEDRSLYPGTCRGKTLTDGPHNLRLDVQKALETTGPIEGHPEKMGDVVIARKDIGTSYHLSVVVDDALQSIDCVIRGQDLLDVTPLHRLLQALLKLPTPLYIHHDLLLDESGQRLAKRSGGSLIRSYRSEGKDVTQLLEKINLFPQ